MIIFETTGKSKGKLQELRDSHTLLSRKSANKLVLAVSA
jgi:hypothetical protein